MRRPTLFLPALVFVVALGLGFVMVFAVNRADRVAEQGKLDAYAQQATARLSSRLREHVALLKAAEGFFAVMEGDVSRDDFGHFYETLQVKTHFPGIQGIGFAPLIATEDTAAANAEIAQNYDAGTHVFPLTDQDLRTPVTLLEPYNQRNAQAIGYDMYSEANRRAAFDRARRTGAPSASAPIELVQEITEQKQAGFLLVVPWRAPDAYITGGVAPVAGFVYAPFRVGDLVNAALKDGSPLPLALTIRDRDAPQEIIYETPGYGDHGDSLAVSVPLPVEGRVWTISYHLMAPAAGYAQTLPSILLSILSLLFALAAALGVHAKQREAQTALTLVGEMEREAEHRALLLREMKHRIKNHIARIQSIARQSIRSSSDLDSFSATFSARLQAMAAVQDVLTDDEAPSSALCDILRQELRQCLSDDDIDAMIAGPDVRLDEAQSHAMAVVAHELTTNAMKYGGLSGAEPDLSVKWRIAAGDGARTLSLIWKEATAPFDLEGERNGFGTKLITAMARGELNGTLDRRFEGDCYVVDLSFPLSGPGSPDAPDQAAEPTHLMPAQ